MAEQLKNVYTKEYIKNLAFKIEENYPTFDTTNFINDIFDQTWQSLEEKGIRGTIKFPLSHVFSR